MNPLVLEFLGVVVRWLLTSVGGYLVAQHILTADQSDRFSNALVEHFLLSAPAAAGLLWGLWVRYRGRIKFLTALESRPGTTEQQVKKTISDGFGASVKMPIVLLALALAGATLTGCAPKTYHAAVVADVSLGQAIFALQDAEIASHNAHLISDVKHAEYKVTIRTLLQAGDDLTVTLQHWDPAQPPPASINLAITLVSNLLSDLNLLTPTLNNVIGAAHTVLSILRGVGVLSSGPLPFLPEVIHG